MASYRPPLQEGRVNVPSLPPKSPTFKSPMLRFAPPTSTRPKTTSTTASATAAFLKKPATHRLMALPGPGKSVQQQQPVLSAASRVARPHASVAAKRDDETRDTSEHREWQRQWRLIMAESHIFFDGVDDASVEKVKPSLAKIGSTVETFFGSVVTHIVTRRPILDTEYPATDVLARAKQLSIKIWTYDKLIRFLTNLLGYTPRPANFTGHPHATKLSHMLREEKLVGPNDRDPHTKRDDHHYFKGPYLMLWDPTHHYRPFMMKEYAKVDSHLDGDWPRFHVSTHGRSPFIESRGHHHRVVALGKRSAHPAGADNDPRKILLREDQDETAQETRLQIAEPVTPRVLMQQEMYTESATTTPVTPAALATRSFTKEMMASGINTSTMTSAIQSVARSAGMGSGATTGPGGGNGLTPVMAQVPSRELSKLKRQTLARSLPPPVHLRTPLQSRGDSPSGLTPSITTTAVAGTSSSTDSPVAVRAPPPPQPPKSGFCENCREEFDDITIHVESKKHRRFATDPASFLKLDMLISTLDRKLKFQDTTVSPSM